MSVAPHFTTYAKVVQHLNLAPRVQQANLVHQLGQIATKPGGGHGIIQAGTGVGKSVATLSVAASVGSPGSPAIILTVSNALSTQYIEKDAPDVARATGMTFTRVMGAKHYICADSSAARMDGVVGKGDMPEFDGWGAAAQRDKWKANAREEREAWLAEQVDPRSGYATEWERTTHSEEYACPGYPTCGGGTIGGCGKRNARARSWDVDVVVTNFNVAACQVMYAETAKLIPLDTAAMVFVDEAHEMPDRLADVLTTNIGPKFATRSKLPTELVDLVHAVREQSTTGQTWGDVYDTVRAVSIHPTDAANMLHQAEQAEAAILAEKARKRAAGTSTEDEDRDDEAPGALDTIRRLAKLTLTPADAGPTTAVCVYRRTTSDKRADSLHLEVVEAQWVARAILGHRGALVSGTVPRSLAARVGMPEIVPTDVGHPFDYAGSVVGFISTVEGVKYKRKREDQATHEWRINQRVAELDAFIADGSALVLCSAHNDVDLLIQRLVPRLQMRGLHVYTQPREGGSPAAMAVAQKFKAHGPGAVLIGTDTYATGLDCPGDMLTRVALWVHPRGIQSHPVDQYRARFYPGYFEDRIRTKVAQGIGRLLRRTTDRGSIYLGDVRFVQHLNTANTPLDSHLRHIPWQMVSPTTPAVTTAKAGA